MSAPAPALGHRRPGRPRRRTAVSGNARASTPQDLGAPVAPRHEDTVVAFHSGRLNPPTRGDELAARVLVDRLLCEWCGNSRVARLCKCRWTS